MSSVARLAVGLFGAVTWFVAVWFGSAWVADPDHRAAVVLGGGALFAVAGLGGVFVGRARISPRPAVPDGLTASYESLFERSLDCVFLFDLDGVLVDANAAALALGGRERHEAVGLRFAEVMHPDSRGDALEAFRHAIEDGAPGEPRQFLMLRADGACAVVELTASVVARGDTPYGVLGVVRDITARIEAADELERSEERFRTLVEQSIVGFYMLDADHITYANRRFAEIFGYDHPDDLVGLRHWDLVLPEDHPTLAENIRRRMAGEVSSISYSLRGVRRDGSTLHFSVHGTVASYCGKPTIMGLLQDTSERDREEQRARKHLEQLEAAMRGTIEMVATMGQLRDPYTRGHERRVGEIAARIAEELGLDPHRVEGVRVAGYLHDVGKIAIPAEILTRPGSLSPLELELVRSHAERSHDILRNVAFPWPVAEVAWQHHERLDGSGYPRGLSGDEILFEARIVAVADTIEAMATHRPYRPGLGLEPALAEIEAGRGVRYDAEVCDAVRLLFRERGYTLPE